MLLLVSVFCRAQSLFVETESFTNKGGWSVDQQFMDLMGSPYLLAHGLGFPVEDATTTVNFPKKGTYYLWVRSRNWASLWTSKAPGQFQVLIDGRQVGGNFGVSTPEWWWVEGGSVEISSKKSKISLHDLTGFDGRCDALFFTKDKNFIPPSEKTEMAAWRKQMLGLPDNPESAGTFDFVIVGGGMAGTCAAISAARLGVKVALIQDRPVLGGNNSSEVRVHLGGRIKLEPYPNLGNLVNEIGPKQGGNAKPYEYYEDDKKLFYVEAEKNISLFLNYRANKVVTEGDKIKEVVAVSTETGQELVFSAPLFADCTGDGTIGYLAGADYMMGRESRGLYKEETAPEEADMMTMGSSIQWFAEEKDAPTSFPDIDWGLPWDDVRAEAIKRGDWNWETGMNLNQINDFERVRDYGLLVVFSNWSYLKNHSSRKDEFSKSQMKWVAFVAGKRESRRLVGDYILKEQDLTEHNVYPDGTAPTSWTIDLHYPDPANSRLFPDKEFKSIAKHIAIYPYPIPFRCLYSKNISNLMMAGRNISVTHVALGTVRLMRTTGMMGEVIGMAASVCKYENTDPRGVYQDHLDKLIERMKKGVGKPGLENIQKYNLGETKQD
ncbi:MAG: FAD-dependent oxidoreductase [Prolixibacteraceae bacterium]|nr:FAD-dependent oxidoreductase [Prolixibacteraceae bacterium]